MGSNLVTLPNGGTAFVCGGKKDHVCDDKRYVLILDDESQVEGTPENEKKYDKRIRGASVVCSICGESAIDNAMWM